MNFHFPKALKFLLLMVALMMGAVQAAAEAPGFVKGDRTPAGTDYSIEVPNQKLSPWDDTRLTQWLVDYARGLESGPSKVSPESASDQSFRPIYDKLSYYFTTTYDAIGAVTSGETQSEFDGGAYILARNCEKYDPWACFNLGMMHLERPEMLDLPSNIRFQLFRRAADADYTLATHWLIRHEGAVPSLWSVDDQEVYLRRARDVDADFAFTQLAVQLGDFYAKHHPERDDGGYLKRATDLLRANGDAEYADWLDSL